MKPWKRASGMVRSEEHTSELQSPCNLVCRLLLEKKVHFVERHLCELQADVQRGLHCFQTRSDRSRRSHRRKCLPRRPRFFFNDTATTEIYPLSLHDALPICLASSGFAVPGSFVRSTVDVTGLS